MLPSLAPPLATAVPLPRVSAGSRASSPTAPALFGDAANVHFYWTWEENLVSKLQAQVEAAAKQTGKKVWVTEFGLNDKVATDAQAASFLSDCIKYLEGASEVAGYSYFKVGSDQYNLNSGSSGLATAYSS